MDEWSSPELEALPEELIQFVKPELQPGERLLWAGTARPRPAFTGRPPWSSTFVATSFLGLSLALFFAIFGPLRRIFLFAEGFVILVGLISALIGIVAGIIAVGSWIERRASRGHHTVNTYALTERRAILWIPQTDSGAIEVHSIARGTVKAVHRLEYPDGSGDVKFDYPGEEYLGPRGLDAVADVRLVEDLARRILIGPGPFQTT
jgi:hypothetical protein